VSAVKPGLLVLDFDGVICDGVAEMVESSWRTLARLAPASAPLTDELRERFRELRPTIESGWEMVVLVGVLSEQDPARDDGLKSAAGWATARDAYLEAHGLAQARLSTEFDASRVDWIRRDRASWVAAHRFYPGVADWLRRLIREDQLVYILSTKSKEFLDVLVESQDVPLPSERVIGRAVPRRDKWDVLAELAMKHRVDPSDVWFVEDRLETLLDMRRRVPDFQARVFFADWGYVFPEDTAAAQRAGVSVLALEQATGPFEEWPANP
jgi:phosphoglycolate phosphatase-like HAD superfamily hydrolase